MQDYRKSLERFEKATPINIYLVAISARADILQEFSEIVMKMNKRASKCTLHNVRKFKEALCDTAAIQSYSVQIDSINMGSVQVVLHYPSNCTAFIFAALTPNFLHTHHLTEVSVDGQYLKIQPEDKEELVCVYK